MSDARSRLLTLVAAMDSGGDRDAPSPAVDRGNGGGDDDGDMEARIAKLEAIAEKTGERLAAIDARLLKIETMTPTLATKSDIADLKTDLHKQDGAIKGWMLTTVIGLFLGFGGLFFAMSNAQKAVAPPSQPQQPVIVMVPQAPPTAAAPKASGP